MTENTHKEIQLKDYRPPAYLVETIDLYVALSEKGTIVTSTLACQRNTSVKEKSPLHFNGKELELVSLQLDDVHLSATEFSASPNHLTIYDVPDTFELIIITFIKPHENHALEGLYKSADMFCSQCEAEGFRRITYFPDRPDILARYTTTIAADREKYPVLLSNGNLIEAGNLENGKHYAKWQDPFPKPSYLFALVAGNLELIEDVHQAPSGRQIKLQIYTHHHNIDKCDHAMNSLKAAMKWDEQNYGLECDLDQYMIVAADDFNMGAMENKGLNIFNSKYVLCSPDTATDSDYEAIEEVVAHEYFHNWTGNRVTCRDWFQLSLKEGLTVFRDQQFTADIISGPVKRINDVRLLRNVQFQEDAGPMAHPVRPQSYIEINNFYTVTIYEKGAEIIRMLHTLLGEEKFIKAVTLYLSKHDGQAATTDDFVKAMEDASGKDLTQFKLWYSQSGTPEVYVTTKYNKSQKTYTITVKQSCPPTPGQSKKNPYHIPFSVGLLDKNGNAISLQLKADKKSLPKSTQVLDITKKEEKYTFINLSEPPVPSLLRGFSAPVKLDYNYSEEELYFLWHHDNDPFNRWEAGQRLAKGFMLQSITDLQQQKPVEVPEQFITVFGQLLKNKSIADKTFQSQLLSLPSEEYLADQLEVIDVDAVHEVRKHLCKTLATSHKKVLATCYSQYTDKKPYQYSQAAAGLRRMKNLCLAYLMETGDSEAYDRAYQQFQNNNMTESIAGFHCLVHHPNKYTDEIIDTFYKKWKKEPLVLDKWLAIQATIPEKETLAIVKRLMDHPSFSIKNPNRVRALIGSFVRGNPISFHNKDGSGYKFLTEQIVAIDSFNSQIAARLAGVFSRWRRYDEKRQKLMQNQLKYIKKQKISRDLYEIVYKSLTH